MSNKVSILLMYDNGRSARWSLGTATARILFFLMIVLPVAVVASVALNCYLLRDRHMLQDQVAERELERDRQAQALIRLTNLEQYIQRNDPASLNRLLLVMGMATMESGLDEYGFPSIFDTMTAEPEALPAAAPDELPGLDPEEGIEANPVEVIAADTLPAEDTPLAAGEVHPEFLTEGPLDTGYARVENLSARRVGARSLRISFDLYNTEKVAQLAGHAAFELVLPDGTVYPLDARGDTNYRINRLKRIIGNPTLPPEVAELEEAWIRLSVFFGNDCIYRVLLPLQ